MNLTKFFLAVPTQVFSLYTASRTSVETTSYMLTRLTHIQLSKIFYLLFMLLNSFIKIVFQATLLKFKQYLLYEQFGLKDNRGTPPSVYVQIIDD